MGKGHFMKLIPATVDELIEEEGFGENMNDKSESIN